MMNILELQLEIKKIVEENIKGYDLKLHPDCEKTTREPIVIIGNQPKEILEDIIPCVIIKSPNGKNTLLEKIITLTVDIIIYETISSVAYTTLYELVEKLANSIVEKGIVSEYYEISPVYEWQIASEDIYPYWAGTLVFSIIANKNDYRKDVDDFIFGRE